MLKIIVTSIASLCAPTSAAALTVHLTCQGTGSVDHLTGTSSDLARSSSEVGGQVKVDLVEGAGRIQLPHAMIPTFHSGRDGWSELKEVREDGDEIRATVVLGFLRNPKVRIDRLSGNLSIDGSDERFSASCQPYDPGAAGRKF